jgi:hypothetical protein
VARLKGQKGKPSIGPSRLSGKKRRKRRGRKRRGRGSRFTSMTLGHATKARTATVRTSAINGSRGSKAPTARAGSTSSSCCAAATATSSSMTWRSNTCWARGFRKQSSSACRERSGTGSWCLPTSLHGKSLFDDGRSPMSVMSASSRRAPCSRPFCRTASVPIWPWSATTPVSSECYVTLCAGSTLSASWPGSWASVTSSAPPSSGSATGRDTISRRRRDPDHPRRNGRAVTHFDRSGRVPSLGGRSWAGESCPPR